MVMIRRRITAAVALGLALGACSDGTGPDPVCEPETVTLALYQATVVKGDNLSNCKTLTGEDARYWVIPQFATDRAGRDERTFQLGPAAGQASASIRAVLGQPRAPSANLAQASFDAALRRYERDHGAAGEALTRATALNRELSLARASVAPPTLGSTRTFSTLATLSTPPSYSQTTATLKYIGEHVYLYLDNQAPPNGFSDAELNAFGDLFDQTLYDLDVQLFGAPSDIDADGHIIVLLASQVNKLTNRADCPTEGFVTGYFFGADLFSTASTSNRGEVFYALVPDPGGTLSCAHSVAQVTSIVPGTFVHEFQHMISYNHHVLVRQGEQEVTWLNEGLSLIAEENASIYYENKYPPPSGRTDPSQLFPDSSQGFIVPDLIDAFNYLAASTENSVTTFESFGTLEERGGAWLFLRWLGDQKGRSIYGSLVQTRTRSIANVEEKAGEPFGDLFGDFGLATLADSIPGVARAAVPARYRFGPTRNLRQIYDRLFTTGAVPSRFPIIPRTTTSTALTNGAMLPGTMDFFTLQPPTPGSPFTLRFAPPSGGAFAENLEAQFAIFRYQ
jgi:hypothetical protein